MLSLAFAKLVATPTDTAWSQVYNAGNLFAVLSLSKEASNETVSLSVIGKEMFAALESEFFTLEHKNLQSIKEALANSTHKIPLEVTANLCIAFFKNNILYVFIFGKGSIIMKRGANIGTLLEKKTDEGSKIVSASGFLENDDTIVLQTPEFSKDTLPETLSSALDLILPNDIAEALSPGMHEKDDGGQAAIIINYKDANKPVSQESPDFPTSVPSEEEIVPDMQKTQQEEVGDIPSHPTENMEEVPIKQEENLIINDNAPTHASKELTLPKISIPAFFTSFQKKLFMGSSQLRLNHKKKIFLTIAVIILSVLATSILLTKKREEDSKTKALFHSVYDPALNNYEDGKSVESINKIFARDEFLKSQKILLDGKSKFKKGTNEEKQISDLLAKIEAELGGTSSGNVIKPKQIDPAENSLLSIAQKTSDGASFTKDTNNIYYVTSKAVVSVDNKGAEKDIIKNDSHWEKPLGIATYQGNMYVLDPEEGVLKFTAGSSGFGKSSYLKEKPGNIGNASGIAIDGSVWVLLKDGSIAKYTRGVSDGFRTKGLDKPMRSPTRIVTDLDTEGLYVLDPVNARIVEFTKDGNYENQYNADILKSAKEFEVSESDGKILVLSGGKFYELPL